MRNFSDLTEREILALAIANEEEDGRDGAVLVMYETAVHEGQHMPVM